ncbi:hypothetical protein E0Z10_g3902 [Xylaria hypoxylon]|uniref:Heterokaryon incompatibility domain-containing protein n=1 Tax=Xylaria hypoxylon TaxID=37992 RepID=A0A4Z0YKK3_9PEZI|nr:hypothetical protein E0Z10_g3902 [Xylaria hypoxylon]
MSRHESLRAAGPKDVAGIIQFLADGGLPDTRWSTSELEILRGYVSAWPHWNTPLHRMIATKQRDGIDYLLDHGAGVHFLNSLGRTPLQEATRLGYYEGVELLLAHGADPNMPSERRTAGHEVGDCNDLSGKGEYVLPIHDTLRNGDIRMLRILVGAGADINKPSEGWMPLDLALIDRQANLMNALFELGASFSPIQETIYYEKNNREKAAYDVLLAASHSDWFPPRSCHSVFTFVLATCNINQYTTTGPSGNKGIDSDRLIRDFFKAVSSIAQKANENKERTIRQSPLIDDYENGTSSSSSFQVAKAWLHNCITNHEACGQSHASTTLPTRVVDVGDGTHDPFLFESNGMRHSYCALSYCWGTSSNAHIMTTKNVQQYYKAISPHELPRTLLDAIDVARGMGFKYLWIDALCIIQDDNGDWLREAVKMGQVYANAALTITTSVGNSSDDGLFRSHPDGFFNPQQLHIRLPKRDRIRETLPVRDSDLSVVRLTHPLSYLAIYPDANFPFIGVTESPIETRAWTLQEQILSKRILYYGEGVVLWECLDATASEHDPDGRRGYIQFPDRMRAKLYFHSHMNSRSRDTRLPTNCVPSDSETPASDEHFAAYCRLLGTYGNRLVTKPSDRIAAVLGLGQVIQEISGNEFIAGIWKGDYALASLCWYLETPSPKGRTRAFPTWSWASMLPDSETRVLNNIGEAEVAIDWTAKVVSFDVQSDLSQTEVKGSITLEGRLGKLKDDESYVMSLKGTLRTTPYVYMDLASDKEAPENYPANIWYFEIAILSGDEGLPSKVRLLLRQVGGADSLTFERIGMYQHIIGEDVNDVQTVVLI